MSLLKKWTSNYRERKALCYFSSFIFNTRIKAINFCTPRRDRSTSYPNFYYFRLFEHFSVKSSITIFSLARLKVYSSPNTTKQHPGIIKISKKHKEMNCERAFKRWQAVRSVSIQMDCLLVSGSNQCLVFEQLWTSITHNATPTIMHTTSYSVTTFCQAQSWGFQSKFFRLSDSTMRMNRMTVAHNVNWSQLFDFFVGSLKRCSSSSFFLHNSTPQKLSCNGHRMQKCDAAKYLVIWITTSGAMWNRCPAACPTERKRLCSCPCSRFNLTYSWRDHWYVWSYPILLSCYQISWSWLFISINCANSFDETWRQF